MNRGQRARGTYQHSGPMEYAEIGGDEVPQGTELILLLEAANRTRRGSPSPRGFFRTGRATHRCRSARARTTAWASRWPRLEAQVARPALLHRFPDLRLTERPICRDRLTLRGWAALPVALGSVD
jgi:cytochrome P450